MADCGHACPPFELVVAAIRSCRHAAEASCLARVYGAVTHVELEGKLKKKELSTPGVWHLASGLEMSFHSTLNWISRHLTVTSPSPWDIAMSPPLPYLQLYGPACIVLPSTWYLDTRTFSSPYDIALVYCSSPSRCIAMPPQHLAWLCMRIGRRLDRLGISQGRRDIEVYGRVRVRSLSTPSGGERSSAGLGEGDPRSRTGTGTRR